MVFNSAIPQPGDSPATDSQAQLLENFAQLNSQFGTAGDHVAFTAGADNGMHKQISLNGVIADPGLPDPQASLYLKTIAGDSHLFFENFDVGGAANVIRQMTGLAIPNLVNAGTAGGSLYRIDFPIGVTVYAGVTNLMTGNRTVTFPVAYTALFTSQATPHDNNGSRTVALEQAVGVLNLFTANNIRVAWLSIGII